MSERTMRDGVLQLRAPRYRWLSTGWDGGFWTADVAHAISVPDDWQRTDLHSYVETRLDRAGFSASGPTLLTAVDLEHARGARLGAVEVSATVGLSNPATLPMEPEPTAEEPDHDGRPPGHGTVNLVVETDRALDDAALANLVAVATEAKTATLLAETGFTGTTTDAVLVGCNPDGERATFTGSATPVGTAARACVRDAIRASLTSSYPASNYPESVPAAEHGVTTAARAEVFVP